MGLALPAPEGEALLLLLFPPMAEKRPSLLIKGAIVVTPSAVGPADVFIADGLIRAVGSAVPAAADQVIEARGLHLLPGAIDPQVHFRDPGLTWKEDLETGSRAAAAWPPVSRAISCRVAMSASAPKPSPKTGTGRPAAFLDRDGTILVDPAYLHQPERVRFFPGAAEAIGRLNAAGYVVVSVSNQSGIARGMFREGDYHAVMRRLADLLAEYGARLDGSYFCPHYPAISGPCECRKPGLKLFRDAQAAHGIDFARSVFVGDRLSDVEPARQLGGKGFLVETGRGAEHVAQARVLGVPVVPDLAAAVEQIVRAA